MKNLFILKNIALKFLFVFNLSVLLSTALAQDNLALNKQCAASSVQAGTEFTCEKAVDGIDNLGSRWESTHQLQDVWWMVDLGAPAVFDSVYIIWEHSGSGIFHVQVWDGPGAPTGEDNSDWITVAYDSVNVYLDPPIDRCLSPFSLPAMEAQYIRVRGFSTMFDWGQSIVEFQLFRVGTDAPSAPVDILGGGTVNPPGPVERTNIALDQPCAASSNSGNCGNAFNGDTTSRWESVHQSDDEWIYVDLGQTYNIDSVAIHWEHSLALVFKIQVWNDAAAPTNDDDARWVTVHDFTAEGGTRWPAGWPDDGRTFLDKISFTAVDARYVRVRLLDREFSWGFSIWDMFVFNSTAAVQTSAPAQSARSIRYQKTPAGIIIDISGIEASHAEVLSADGRLVQNLESRGIAGTMFWNTSNAVNGIYYLRVVGTDETRVIKIPVFGK